MRRLSTLTLAAAVSLPFVNAAAPNNFSAARAGPAARKRAPRIVPSPVFVMMRDRKRSQPNITAEELASFGNGLIAKHGFNYNFNSCEIVEANKNPPRLPDLSATAKAYYYPLRRVGGGKVTFQIVADVYDDIPGGMCGECFFDIPSLRVTRDKMLVIAEGRRVWLKRPPEFDLDEVQFVDRTLKKVLRSWQITHQTIPLGLSPDRTKLYIDSRELSDLGVGGLAVEISDAGVRLVAADKLNLPEGEFLKNFPRDPLNAYLSFMRFGKGRGSYILKFSEPCT